MENQYYRTFIAIPVRPGPGLLSIRNELLSSFTKERISWVQPELFHVTLRFLGNTQIASLTDISEALRKEVNTPNQAEVRVHGVGSFGPKNRPRVIWAGFEDPLIFDLLKRDVDLALQQCGIPMEDFPFNAHLTLGRVRGLKNLSAYYEQIERLSPQLKEAVLIDRLVFYRSVLGTGGPRYSVLEEFFFSPSGYQSGHRPSSPSRSS